MALRCHKNTSVTGVVGSFQTPNDAKTQWCTIPGTSLYDNSYPTDYKLSAVKVLWGPKRPHDTLIMLSAARLKNMYTPNDMGMGTWERK